MALIGLPGLRFASDLGTEWVLLVLSYAVSSVLAFIGVRGLRKGTGDRSARLKLTIACGVTLLGAIIGGDDSGSIMFLVSVVGGIMVPLWLRDQRTRVVRRQAALGRDRHSSSARRRYRRAV